MFLNPNQHKNNTCDDAKEIFRNSTMQNNMYHLGKNKTYLKILLEITWKITQYCFTFKFKMKSIRKKTVILRIQTHQRVQQLTILIVTRPLLLINADYKGQKCSPDWLWFSKNLKWWNSLPFDS